MEANVSGFTFFSTFDSGNLATVEAVPSELHPLHGLPDLEAEEMPAEKGGPLQPADYSFRMWTRPDCAGMFLCQNRTVKNLRCCIPICFVILATSQKESNYLVFYF